MATKATYHVLARTAVVASVSTWGDFVRLLAGWGDCSGTLVVRWAFVNGVWFLERVKRSWMSSNFFRVFLLLCFLCFIFFIFVLLVSLLNQVMAAFPRSLLLCLLLGANRPSRRVDLLERLTYLLRGRALVGIFVSWAAARGLWFLWMSRVVVGRSVVMLVLSEELCFLCFVSCLFFLGQCSGR